MPIASFGQEKTWVIEGQSKAWPELRLGQPERLENSPKDPYHNDPQQSKAIGRRKGRMKAVLSPPTQPSGLKAMPHLHTHGHAWSNHTDQTPSPWSKPFPEAPKAQHPPAPQDHAWADDGCNSQQKHAGDHQGEPPITTRPPASPRAGRKSIAPAAEGARGSLVLTAHNYQIN